MYIKAQGHVLEVHGLENNTSLQPGQGGKRGSIMDFSSASRRRLLELTNRLAFQRDGVKFLTLTFTGCPTNEEAKKALRRFYMRLRRRDSRAAVIWRMEYQKRGSIHFHLLMWNTKFWPQRALQRVWEQCTRENRSVVHIKRVMNHKHLIRYVSKYIAKMPEGDGFTSLEAGAYLHATNKTSAGRFWGIWGKDDLPLAPEEKIYALDSEMERYVRWWIRKLSHSRHKNDNGRAVLFTEDAYQMLFWIAANARNVSVGLPDYCRSEAQAKAHRLARQHDTVLSVLHNSKAWLSKNWSSLPQASVSDDLTNRAERHKIDVSKTEITQYQLPF